MVFIAEFEKSSKNQEDRRLPFLNISSSPKVIKVLRRVVAQKKVAKKAVEINQNR